MPRRAHRFTAPRATDALRALALMTLWATSGCGDLTEIVLTIDTDLAVPAEIDQVQVAITGPTRPVAPLMVDLTAASAPAFPLTLGLTPAGALSPVSIEVVGLQAGAPIVTRDVQTSYVSGTSRLLSILLTLSCRDIMCPTDQTCALGACAPLAQPGATLPPWLGKVPGRMSTDATLILGRSVWANGWHSCATKGTSFSCWGRNLDGELGIGTTATVTTRRAVVGLPPPHAVGLGEYHSCICDQTGQAWCWGNNSDGQVGPDVGQDHLTPTAVAGISDCVQIASGGFHTCALRTGGVVSCWGQNTSGQCGQPNTTKAVTAPKQVPTLGGVSELRAGETYTCARQNNGAVVCWGDNTQGQLGDGTLLSRETPARVSNLGNLSELVAGRFFACGKLESGGVSCWGYNVVGGVGSTLGGPARIPVPVPGIDDALQIGIGRNHACVLHVTGGVSCWGDNQFYQLGDATGLSSVTPVDVVDIPNDATSLAIGDVHSCARRASGAIVCWGQNTLQQLGDDDTGAFQMRPINVIGF